MQKQRARYSLQNTTSGQALVLVLLSLAVVLTLILFILSRSITDVAVSSKSEEAVRAFSAAEAGVEQSLVIGTGGSSNFSNNSSYNTNVSSFAAGTSDFNYPLELSSGDSATTWFVNHDENTGNTICDATHPCFTGSSMQICWGKVGTSGTSATTPAIEASVFYETTPGDVSTVQIARAVFDPYAARIASNNFASPDVGSCTISGVSYAFSKTISFGVSGLGIPASAYNNAGGLLFARVRMFYNTDTTQTLGVTVAQAGNSTLPSQGQMISSTGSAGDSNRKLDVFQGWPEPPSVFDSVVYSSTGLTK